MCMYIYAHVHECVYMKGKNMKGKGKEAQRINLARVWKTQAANVYVCVCERAVEEKSHLKLNWHLAKVLEREEIN